VNLIGKLGVGQTSVTLQGAQDCDVGTINAD
jgi:hypothetical protein